MTPIAPIVCADVVRQIQAFVDGELDGVECDTIERHCESCAACAHIVRGLQRTIGLCREVGRAPLPDAISERAREQVKRLLARSRTPGRMMSRRALASRKPIPFAFVLEAIGSLSPETRPMFGCLAVYVREKIVCVLRDKVDDAADNGVWLATTPEHHASLQQEFPNMRSIGVLGKKVTGWQVLPAAASDFEESVLRACDLILARDPRIGKVPVRRLPRVTKPATRSARGGGRLQAARRVKPSRKS
jgi:Putative zinc-finger